ncbi:MULTISPECIES: TOMM precursor leader peptide-binding protein [unclassified Streptomyces]|uniref:TOMM precursor leader peptide-binding protein n=1 Tax=unclassified Streptomyces TaxID=2593676 RepID=UPI002253525F|nr:MULTISPECIES: TOMM precursor leader peptide-binding protein [unclassified Streptomyces]MCX4524132.1 TOMM precursor leader peptide-binding protein [Streptomyces sp. NBC_01551]MCX4545350.1 TOMM precursor leader peptide-binding protein [Streptomyces sp. NBC_01565]
MAHASYQAVAATRPRIRRDVLFTETPDGVLFHNADGGFRLTAKSAYRFATLIVPHLTGEHSVADLCRGLGEAQQAMVGELVRTLYERDFARPVAAPAEEAAERPALAPDVARRFAPQIAYADHYADDAEARFLRFRETRVAVLGDDDVARWCASSLIRNGCASVGVPADMETPALDAEVAEAVGDGCPVELRTLAPAGGREPGWPELADYDLVVVTGGRTAPARLLPLLRAGIPAGRTLLPAWSYGADAVIGPLMAHGTAGCWACAALRLGAAVGRDTAAAAELWSTLALPGSPAPAGPEPGRPLAAMIGNLLGYEVFRATSGALPAETAGQVIVQDMASLDVTAEPLLVHPRCPFCAPAEEDAALEAVAPVDLAAAGTSPAPAPATLETAREADALVEELNRRSALVRPYTGVFTRYADEPLTQIPLKLSVVEFGTGHAGPRAVAAFDVHHVAGARMRALDAAAVLYAEHVVPARGLVARAEGAVAESALTIASGLSGTASAWQRAVSLVTKEPALVPAGAVRPFGPHNGDRLYERTRAGAGAGPTPADAAAAGLLSALAHDALLRAVRGAAAAPVLLTDETPDAELAFLVRSAERLGIAVELLDLGEGARSGVQVLLARAEQRWAVGADLDRQTATVAALRDLLGAVQYERDATASGAPADTGDPLLRDLDARTLTVSADAGDARANAVVAAGWTGVLDRLRAARRDAYAVPTGSADLASAGLHTARVLLTCTQEPGDDH